MPTLVAAAFALVPWPAQDWDIFQAAARLGREAYTYNNGYTGPLTGPLTIVAASVLPYAAAVIAAVALLPLALWRHGSYGLRDSWFGITVAPFWGGLAAWGHLDDAAALVMLLEARRTRGLHQGLLVGAAIATKPWAVIGLAFLLWDRRALAASIASQVLWLPFLPAALSMEKDTVTVRYGSPLRGLLEVEALPPDWLRPFELLAMVFVAWFCCRRGRHDGALAAGLAVKMLLDPGDFDYYWGPWALSLLPLVRGRGAAVTAVSASWLVILPHLYEPTGAWITAVASVAVLAIALLPLEPGTLARLPWRAAWPLLPPVAAVLFVLAAAWELNGLY